MAAADIPPVGESELICPNCGYDLRGIASTLCPECGNPFDRAALGESQIPWTFRQRIGRVRAYWRTARLAAFQPRRLANEMARPVNFADAEIFRRITAWLLWVAAIACAASLIPSLHSEIGNMDWGAWMIVLAATVGLRVFLTSFTASPSVFFRPRSLSAERRHRAAALSLYLCAPLLGLIPALMALSALFLLLALAEGDNPFTSKLFSSHATLLIIAAGFFVLSVFDFWVRSIQLVRWTTHCGPGRALATALLLPVIWVFTGAIFLIGFSLVVAYLLLVALSVGVG